MTRDGLVVENWSRWGLRRLYVNAADDELVGWLDLDTGARSLENPDLASAFDAALEEAATRDDAVHCAPRRTVAEPVADFLFRQPGEHLKDYIAAIVEAGEDLEPACPGFEGRHAYSSWELGIIGEQVVAEELARLVEDDPRWRYLNSIPVGTHDADIDHLVVGPGGVFTINTKHHHDGHVWVGGDACSVNNTWKHYVRNSRAEAERARQLLGSAAATDIAVTGLIVLVGVAKLTVKAQPADVRVLNQLELVEFLSSRPASLDERSIDRLVEAARVESTWVEAGAAPAKSTMGAVSSPDQARWPRTAEELMRSRFEAFRTGDAEWLLASWHPSTRPRQIDLTGNPTWRALQIVETVQGGVADDTGIVEFRATYLRPGGGVDAQHERSRFVREEGRWYYLDAV